MGKFVKEPEFDPYRDLGPNLASKDNLMALRRLITENSDYSAKVELAQIVTSLAVIITNAERGGAPQLDIEAIQQTAEHVVEAARWADTEVLYANKHLQAAREWRDAARMASRS